MFTDAPIRNNGAKGNGDVENEPWTKGRNNWLDGRKEKKKEERDVRYRMSTDGVAPLLLHNQSVVNKIGSTAWRALANRVLANFLKWQ